MPKKPPAEDFFNVVKTDKNRRYGNPSIEWPRDDGHWIGLNARFFSTFVCMECGETSRDHWGAPRCPKGHGDMRSIGTKLRIPRKAKLLRWLKRQKAAK